MSNAGKHDFKKVTNPDFRKQKKIMVRIPKSEMPKLKKLLKKYEIKGIQYLFDMLVIGGICFRRPEILKFVREHVPKYKEETIQRNLARLGKAEKLPKIPMHGYTASMYLSDNKVFHEYIIEENIKQQWLWNILFLDGFVAEEKCIIDLIERAKTLKISSRKKAIARLSEDEYVTTLPPNEAQRLLDQLTQEYDTKTFDKSLEAVIESKLELDEQLRAQREEEELDFELNKKIHNLRQSRSAKINHIVKPDLNVD